MARNLVPLMDALFSATLDAQPWVGFLEALGAYLRCHHPTLVLRKPWPGDPGIVVSTGGHTEAIVALQERVFQDSPFLDLADAATGMIFRLRGSRLRGEPAFVGGSSGTRAIRRRMRNQVYPHPRFP